MYVHIYIYIYIYTHVMAQVFAPVLDLAAVCPVVERDGGHA